MDCCPIIGRDACFRTFSHRNSPRLMTDYMYFNAIHRRTRHQQVLVLYTSYDHSRMTSLSSLSLSLYLLRCQPSSRLNDSSTQPVPGLAAAATARPARATYILTHYLTLPTPLTTSRSSLELRLHPSHCHHSSASASDKSGQWAAGRLPSTNNGWT